MGSKVRDILLKLTEQALTFDEKATPRVRAGTCKVSLQWSLYGAYSINTSQSSHAEHDSTRTLLHVGLGSLVRTGQVLGHPNQVDNG